MLFSLWLKVSPLTATWMLIDVTYVQTDHLANGPFKKIGFLLETLLRFLWCKHTDSYVIWSGDTPEFSVASSLNLSNFHCLCAACNVVMLWYFEIWSDGKIKLHVVKGAVVWHHLVEEWQYTIKIALLITSSHCTLFFCNWPFAKSAPLSYCC